MCIGFCFVSAQFLVNTIFNRYWYNFIMKKKWRMYNPVQYQLYYIRTKENWFVKYEEYTFFFFIIMLCVCVFSCVHVCVRVYLMCKQWKSVMLALCEFRSKRNQILPDFQNNHNFARRKAIRLHTRRDLLLERIQALPGRLAFVFMLMSAASATSIHFLRQTKTPKINPWLYITLLKSSFVYLVFIIPRRCS